MHKHEELDCAAAMARLWDYLDGALTEETVEAVATHLKHCSHCVPHAQFAERFLEALGRCKECQPPMPGALRSKVMSTLKSEGLLT